MTALYVGGMGAKGRNFYNDLVKRYGFEQEAEQIQDLYLDGKKDEAAKLVPDELLEATTLCGSEGYVKERLAAYKESGVTVLNVTPVGPDPVKLIEQVKTWIEELVDGPRYARTPSECLATRALPRPGVGESPGGVGGGSSPVVLITMRPRLRSTIAPPTMCSGAQRARRRPPTRGRRSAPAG